MDIAPALLPYMMASAARAAGLGGEEPREAPARTPDDILKSTLGGLYLRKAVVEALGERASPEEIYEARRRAIAQLRQDAEIELLVAN
jgi:hypothetical protein